MNCQRKTLLAGIAVLALAAGTGLAPAQETPKNQGSQSKPPHATQQMNQAPAGKTGQSAQDQNRGATGRDETKAGKSAKDGDRSAQGHERNGPAAQQQNQGGNNAAAQREHSGMQGLQGNATGMNVRLTDEQRTRIRDTVIRASGAPRVGRVDFDVTVGTVIPRDRIQVIAVPETLVQIEPEWRGFLYFVYEDEVVIVNPSDMRIVAVVPV
jgi:hypothetical protein